ncbi:MAG: D-alanine--D-alanine ligase family protein [Chloroflexia bacterium]
MATPYVRRPDDLGIVVLYNENTALTHGEPQDLRAVRGVIACAASVAEALEGLGRRVVLAPIHTDMEDALAPYPPTEWLVFNLGEGESGHLFEEARIVWALEAMGYLHTGAGGEALARSTNKALAKACLAWAGIPTPPWRLYRHPDEVAPEDLPFPLFVKPVAEDASQGIGEEAIVHDVEGLRRRVAYITSRYRQAALAEAFIAGREFNVSLWGRAPEVLPLAEVDFSRIASPYARIVSFAAKWEEDSFEYRNTPVRCPAEVDSILAERIRDVARRAWAAIGCRGYARVDMRVSADGTPYVLEVNCNPDISPDAGFFRAARAAGYSYPEMVRHILQLAWEDIEEGRPFLAGCAFSTCPIAVGAQLPWAPTTLPPWGTQT